MEKTSREPTSALAARLLHLAVFLLPLTSNAGEPAVLDCYSKFENLEREAFSVRLDEDRRRVTHAGRHETFEVTAVFQADQVIYQHLKSEGFGLQTIHKFIIDRNTLRVTHFVTSKGSASGGSTTETAIGACSAAR